MRLVEWALHKREYSNKEFGRGEKVAEKERERERGRRRNQQRNTEREGEGGVCDQAGEK